MPTHNPPGKPLPISFSLGLLALVFSLFLAGCFETNAVETLSSLNDDLSSPIADPPTATPTPELDQHAYLPAVQDAAENDGWWKPAPGTSWQWQLSGTVDTAVDVMMYDIDLVEALTTTIAELHAAGRTVICYFSAGSWEAFRDDADLFPQEVLGKVMEGWPDERWLDIRRIDLLAPIMEVRLDLAVSKGCDGVEPDNVDGYANDTGFPLTGPDQLAYNRWLAQSAHSRGLSIGLKNDLDQIPQLVESFDWALNEQCVEFQECGLLAPFIQAGKAVFGVEYEGDPAEFCPEVNALNFDWLYKRWDLDAWRVACR